MLNIKIGRSLQWVLVVLGVGIVLVGCLQAMGQTGGEPAVEPVLAPMATAVPVDATVAAQAAALQTLQEEMQALQGNVQALQGNVQALQGDVQALQGTASAQAAAITALHATITAQPSIAAPLPPAIATPTATATPTPGPVTVPRSDAAPRTDVPVLIFPAEGRCYEYSPTFQWDGTLGLRLAHMVRVCNGDFCLQSPPIFCCNSWMIDLPADRAGGWRWTVSVVRSNCDPVATSAEGMFWFNPSGCDDGDDSPPPTMQPPEMPLPTVPPPP